jgi:hypothetical protein
VDIVTLNAMFIGLMLGVSVANIIDFFYQRRQRKKRELQNHNPMKIIDVEGQVSLVTDGIITVEKVFKNKES